MLAKTDLLETQSRLAGLNGERRKINDGIAVGQMALNEAKQRRTEISLEHDYVGDIPNNLKIIPGMTVQADIKTGSKSILDYLMKPVSRGFDHPFKER